MNIESTYSTCTAWLAESLGPLAPLAAFEALVVVLVAIWFLVPGLRTRGVQPGPPARDDQPPRVLPVLLGFLASSLIMALLLRLGVFDGLAGIPGMARVLQVGLMMFLVVTLIAFFYWLLPAHTEAPNPDRDH